MGDFFYVSHHELVPVDGVTREYRGRLQQLSLSGDVACELASFDEAGGQLAHNDNSLFIGIMREDGGSLIGISLH